MKMESDDHHDHDQPTPKNLNDGDEILQGATISSQVTTPQRSYECNFCKRGFSNAQALGGHMNIHRKDKAKLKQQQQQQQQSSSNSHQTQLPSNLEQSNDDQKWPVSQSLTTEEESPVVHMSQLPPFVESPNSPEKKQKQEGQIHELDLELRLGPEPQDSSSSEAALKGTRKFF